MSVSTKYLLDTCPFIPRDCFVLIVFVVMTLGDLFVRLITNNIYLNGCKIKTGCKMSSYLKLAGFKARSKASRDSYVLSMCVILNKTPT